MAETLQVGKRSQAIRVSMTQDGRPISHAVVWTITEPDGRDGIAYDWTEWPEVPGPDGLASFDELRPDEDRPFPFWDNMEGRPIDFFTEDDWNTARPIAPVLQNWYRLRPQATFDDPFLEAARVAMVCDLMGWPSVVPSAATRPGDAVDGAQRGRQRHVPPAPGDSEFLLLDATAPLAGGGTIGAVGRVWSDDRRLLGDLHPADAGPTGPPGLT